MQVHVSVTTDKIKNNSNTIKNSLIYPFTQTLPHPKPLATSDLFSVPAVLPFPEHHIMKLYSI